MRYFVMANGGGGLPVPIFDNDEDGPFFDQIMMFNTRSQAIEMAEQQTLCRARGYHVYRWEFTAMLDEAMGAGIDTPPQVPGWRRMDKMPEQQPQATKGVPVETAPCPDCGAFPYTAEAQFYSGLVAVAVCASCKKPYKPTILEV